MNMHRIVKCTTAPLIMFALVFALVPRSAPAAPAAQTLDEVTVIVSTGDVKEFVDRSCAFASNFMPGTTPADLREKLVKSAGIPELKDIPSGMGVAVVILPDDKSPMGRSVAFFKAPAASVDSIMKVLESQNMKAVKADGLIVASDKEGNTSAGVALARDVNSKVFTGKQTSALHVKAPVGRLINDNDTTLRCIMKSMPEMIKRSEDASCAKQGRQSMLTTATIRLLQAEMLAIYGAAKRIGALDLSVNCPPDGLRIDCEITPAAAAAPAEKPATTLDPLKLVKMLPSNGAVRMAAVFDAKALMEFIKTVMGDALEEMNLTDFDGKQVAAWMDEWAAVTGGGMALNMILPEKPFPSGACIIPVTDPKAVLSMLEESPERLKTIGFLKLYEALGMPMKLSFKKNVETVEGVDVHELKVELDLSRTMPQITEALKSIGGVIQYKLAIVDNFLVYAINGQPIADLIKSVKAKGAADANPLAAEKVFGPGAFMYLDYNIGMVLAAVMDFQSANMPAEAVKMLKKMSAAAANAQPITAAGFEKDGKHMISLHIPLELIKKCVEAGREMSAEAKQVKAEAKQVKAEDKLTSQ